MPLRPEHNFSDSREILKFRPRIEFVEPEQVPDDKFVPEDLQPPETIEDTKDKIQSLIDGYARVEKLADLAQEKVDRIVGNDFAVHLDPAVDAAVIGCMRKEFPDRDDHTKITFADYRHCVEAINEIGRSKAPIVSAEEILAAQQAAAEGVIKVDFGPLGLKNGLARPEVDKGAQMVEPIDLEQFQNQGLATLFNLLSPKIIDLINQVVRPGV